MEPPKLFTIDASPLPGGQASVSYPLILRGAPWPVEWVRVSERGVIGLAPAPEPEPVSIVNGLSVTCPVSPSSTLLSTSYSSIESTPLTGATVQTVAADLNSGQVSRLIRITRDWSKQAELVSEAPREYGVERGGVILNPARPSFTSAYTSYLLYADHHLVPRSSRGEHAWFRAWRLRAARAFLSGATAEALVASLQHRLAELGSNLVTMRASAPRRLAAQAVRLAHFIAPNAPPARLYAQVSC